MFARLLTTGTKLNTDKSCFGAHEFEYLVYHVTRDGVMTTPKKVEAMQVLSDPKTRKKLRQFIGMINFYHDMWQKCSELLAPLTALTSNNAIYECKYKHQKRFDAIKPLLERWVLMAYLDFNAPFEIYTDLSKLHIGTVISKKGKSIDSYSRNMNSAKKIYHNWEITPLHRCISQGVL